MDRKAAARLRPGQRFIYGDTQKTADSEWRGRGRVLFVTPKGGIRVTTLSLSGKAIGEAWVPYHHVIRILDPDE